MGKHRRETQWMRGSAFAVIVSLGMGIAISAVAFLILAKVVEAQGITQQGAILPATLAVSLGAAVTGFIFSKMTRGQGVVCGIVAAAEFSLLFMMGVFLAGNTEFTLYTPLKLFAFTAAGCFGGYLGGLRSTKLRHRRAG